MAEHAESELEEARMTRKGRNPWLLGATILTAVIALTFLLPGCGQNPVSSVPDEPGSHGGGIRGLEYADRLIHSKGSVEAAWVTTPLPSADTVVQTVGTSGGTLTLTTGGHGSTLQIPNGALTSSVSISAIAVEVRTTYGTVDLYDFGPDGLVFAKAAKLTLQVDLPDGATLSLYWWNPVTHRWDWQRSGKVLQKKVTFDVFHFSKYGIG
jgi:hypothetical protein